MLPGAIVIPVSAPDALVVTPLIVAAEPVGLRKPVAVLFVGKMTGT